MKNLQEKILKALKHIKWVWATVAEIEKQEFGDDR